MRDETEILDVLDRVVPPVDDRFGGWDAIVHELRRDGRRRTALRAAALGAAVALAAAAALFWPSSSAHRGGVLDRALAAVGDGPVLHLVLREGWGGQLVDLETGRQRPTRAEREVWYDPARGLHEISRVEGEVQFDELYTPGQVPPNRLAILGGAATAYRDALEHGTAKLAGKDVVDGTPVYWIKVTSQQLPDVADGKLHEFSQQVAVSRDTYEPVATRDARDGVTGPDGITRIEKLEQRPSGSGNFERLTPKLDGVALKLGVAEDIDLVRAQALLGRPPLLPTDTGGLPRTRLARMEFAQGYDRASGRWRHELDAVGVWYGVVENSAAESGDGGRSLRLTEAAKTGAGFGRGLIPPDGKMLLQGAHGFLRSHGLYLEIDGPSPRAVLRAALSLE